MKPLLSLGMVLAGTLLGACSSDDTTTFLDVQNDAINLTLPELLIDASDDGLFDNSLRPVVTLSNGVTVSINQGVGNQFSGSVNLPANASYEVTVTWVETFQQLTFPLARRIATIQVAADGTAVEVQNGLDTSYLFDFDFDGDGLSNFDERTDNDPDTDPLRFD